jgi:hypothetical protein
MFEDPTPSASLLIADGGQLWPNHNPNLGAAKVKSNMATHKGYSTHALAINAVYKDLSADIPPYIILPFYAICFRIWRMQLVAS